ncbi:MAG: M28 family peptidase [Bacteroidales bacterium]|nr:M28 family peptidase [Bacteroidales bacterium]
MYRITFLIFFIGLAFLSSCKKDIPEIENSGQVRVFANSIDTSHIMPWVEELTQVHLNDEPVDNEGFPPSEGFPSDHLTRTAAVGYITNELTRMGYNVDTLELGGETLVAYNVVAEHKGTVYPGEVVLMGAHLDAFYGGADDNCSAIAALLAVANATKNFSFERTIRFVAFDLEEFGSIGSTRYVEEGYANDVVSAVVLDLIGYSSDEPGSQDDVMGVRFPNTGDFICVIGNEYSASITQKVVNFSYSSGIGKTKGVIAPDDGTYFLSGAFMRSDHGLMWFKGIPSIFFSDGANFRNPHYHKPGDLPETLNRNFLNENTKIIAASVALLAGIQP